MTRRLTRSEQNDRADANINAFERARNRDRVDEMTEDDHVAWQMQANEAASAEASRRRAAAKAVSCPACGAQAKKPCRTRTGKRAEELHAGRFSAAGVHYLEQ